MTIAVTENPCIMEHESSTDGAQIFGSIQESKTKLRDLEALLGTLDHAAIAYSGGVDSAFLLKVASRVLGDRVVAFTAVSPSMPPEEREHARDLAGDLGVVVFEVETREMEDPQYRENGPDRCFFCKTHLFTKVIEEARKRGIEVVLDGNNRDDAGDYRPGLRASAGLGVRSPLMEVGMTKQDIRTLSRHMNLRTWNKPAMPCLSSRIPYYNPVTEEKLDQIGRAERFLRGLGFDGVRVRHHNDVARIEVEPHKISDLAASALRTRVEEKLRSLGFTYVALDLGGFRSGNLNRGLGVSKRPEEE